MNSSPILTQRQLAAALELSPASITKLKGQGMPVHSVNAARDWRARNQRAYAGSASSSAQPPAPPPAAGPQAPDRVPDYQESRARREAAEAGLAELKVQQQMGTLVEAAAVRAEFARQTSAVRDGLLNIPARLAPVLAAETSVGKVQTLLDTEIRAVLAQFVGEA